MHGAAAHDTWFAPGAATGGRGALALSTGNRFPVAGGRLDPQYFAACSGCRTAPTAARRPRCGPLPLHRTR